MGFEQRVCLLVGVGCLLAASVAIAGPAGAKRLPRLKVHESHRFLMTEDGKPFFYLADTGWELFHRLDRKQALQYLDVRADQGFTAIQAVALAELDGVGTPNAYGKLPLIDRDPTRPAVTPGANPADPKQYDYWDHVDFIVEQANRRGIYIAMLPAWGRWVTDKDKIFTVQNAQVYGEFLGKRYGKKGIIWILGGDRGLNGFEDVERALARGIAIGVSGKEDYDAVLMSLHPPGGGSSSQWFHNDVWLGFNMLQTGHSQPAKTMSWLRVQKDYERTPAKPVIDGEPLYEDHPLAFRAKEFGYSNDSYVRQSVYWDVFAGACGQTYGNHSVWQMFAPGRARINGPLAYWYDAIGRPGAAQMKHLRKLIESRPYFSRVPDQSLIVNALEGADHVGATRGDGYALIYSAQGRPFEVNLGKISGQRLTGYWYNPRSGSAEKTGSFDNNGTRQFEPPSQGFGSDWVLVLDDESKKFDLPGQGVVAR